MRRPGRSAISISNDTPAGVPGITTDTAARRRRGRKNGPQIPPEFSSAVIYMGEGGDGDGEADGEGEDDHSEDNLGSVGEAGTPEDDESLSSPGGLSALSSLASPSLVLPSPSSLASPCPCPVTPPVPPPPLSNPGSQPHNQPVQPPPPHRNPVGTNPHDINNPLSVNQLTGQCIKSEVVSAPSGTSNPAISRTVKARSTLIISGARIKQIKLAVMLHHSDCHVVCVKNASAVGSKEHGQRFGQIEGVEQSSCSVIVNVYRGSKIANDEDVIPKAAKVLPACCLSLVCFLNITSLPWLKLPNKIAPFSPMLKFNTVGIFEEIVPVTVIKSTSITNFLSSTSIFTSFKSGAVMFFIIGLADFTSAYRASPNSNIWSNFGLSQKMVTNVVQTFEPHDTGYTIRMVNTVLVTRCWIEEKETNFRMTPHGRGSSLRSDHSGIIILEEFLQSIDSSLVTF
ncbi:hypothetical protein WN51_08726 [Melipona quadrifasciata]|uniref:Uncharacterized protein n=1 Tax=Melipona quadrifasciata TaxID=166423 RepID=A0A0N0U2R9_9HYME|nr:hypothetical protein WN51_08726 [Melipona quadrifasciata]